MPKTKDDNRKPETLPELPAGMFFKVKIRKAQSTEIYARTCYVDYCPEVTLQLRKRWFIFSVKIESIQFTLAEKYTNSYSHSTSYYHAIPEDEWSDTIAINGNTLYNRYKNNLTRDEEDKRERLTEKSQRAKAKAYAGNYPPLTLPLKKD